MKRIQASINAVLGVVCIVGIHLAEASTTHRDAASKALHLEWLDTKVSPSQDFYTYANGSWQKKHPIPSHYASWGSFQILQETVQKRIHRLLIQASRNHQAKPGSDAQKIGDFYFSGMDEAAIERAGISPLKPEFERIDAIQSVDDLQGVVTYLQQIGVNALFDFSSMQDFANSEAMIGVLYQAGLGLPDKEYYLKKGAKFQNIRQAYLRYMTHMFELLGESHEAALHASDVVMDIETRLARASMSKTEQRDPHAIYHIKTIAQLQKTMPNFAWSRFFSDIGHSEIQRVNLGTPVFFNALNTMLQNVALEDWKLYLRWHVLDGYAPYLSKVFVKEHFDMVSTLTGTKTILPRWMRVVNAENQALGFAIGKLYVQRYFPPQSKGAVTQIVNGIRNTLRQDLQTLTWMTPATRKAAIKKLDAMEERIGYPEKWWDYSSLHMDRTSYVSNIKRSNQFLVNRDRNKIGKPIDRTEWAMTPQTVNAYYDASMNNINLPAGILQPPFFDPNAPDAVNYGSIGFVVAHEMTHGFDDQGAQFDGHGDLKNWWTEEDLKRFRDATHCIAEQFSQYTVDGDIHLQGSLVVGEATADLGGLILAYRAFHASKAYKTAKTLDGFTPDQQFFLGAAHVWTTNIRSEQLRNLAMIDPHPPAQYRVNGTIANMPQFQKAFHLPNTSAMVREKPCVIW